MAPEHSAHTGCFWLDSNRHSPRIFNKNLTKLDISTVNTKVDFMRSLNLFCTRNTKEFHAKLNWDVVVPKDKENLRLKKCSVVIDNAKLQKCDTCGESITNKTNMKSHKSLHLRLTRKDYENNNDTIMSEHKCDNNNHLEQGNLIECNNNTMRSLEKVKPNKKNVYRRRSKDVTKLTLKIGGEVISKVYCKKKYLNKVCSKDQKLAEVHQHENCESCHEIKTLLRDKTMGADKLTEETDRNVARLRKMAAALVEHEIKRKAMRTEETQDFINPEMSDNLRNDDAVVPVADNDLIQSNNDAEEDDIQEVLRIAPSHKRKALSTIKNYEVITIDDDMCDSFEDDCVIVDERLSHQNDLSDNENTYSFDVSNRDDASPDVINLINPPTSTEKRKSMSNVLIECDSTVKKSRIDNTLNLQYNDIENVDVNRIHKENKQYHGPIIKLSQFALPLRLINF